ncbi:MAG: PAS domain S-box protein [Bacteroidota bacterium]
MILLTGRGNHEIDILAMEAGAVDYLVKSDINIEKLERAIRYAVGRHDFIKALKANEQKFRSIFEKSKDCIFIADEQFFFKDVNQAACTLFEYSKEEMLDMSLLHLLGNKEDQKIIEQGLVVKGEVSDKELNFVTKDNERIDGILSVSRELDDKGNYYLQGIIHDITNLKKAERATLQAEKLKATERLVMTLAHEVRNPLNNINLSAQQLSTEITSDEPQLYLEIINRNSKRIGDLITELLHSSRPTEIELQKISLTAVLDESIAAAFDSIQLKRITLEADYHHTEGPVTGDPGKLKIAFLNIIINAVEAMKEGEGRLSIQVINESSAYIVSIKDNGTGISEENLTKLFEPYYTSKPNGMGLGLASTLSILQSHKASVDVNSKPGREQLFLSLLKSNNIYTIYHHFMILPAHWGTSTRSGVAGR